MIARDWNCAQSLNRVDPERPCSKEHLGHGVMDRHLSVGFVNRDRSLC
jgi:hypothetical protein